MGRIPRNILLYDGCYAHVISRSIAKQRIFDQREDFLFFESLLVNARDAFKFAVFHYCLMHTHFHLVVSMASVLSFSEGMKQVKKEYTGKYNKDYKRRGPLWQNRFKSLLIEDESYLYGCGLYVEQNPVRAGLVEDIEGWEFSSSRHYLKKVNNPLVTGYGSWRVPDDLNFSDGFHFERGSAVGSELFKFKLRKGIM